MLAIVVAVIVSYRTTPKPESELVGLVRSLTPHEALPRDRGVLKSPIVLTVISVVIIVGGYIFFAIV